MPWIEFFQGFFVLFRPEITISLWASKGVPFEQSLLTVVCWTSIALVIIYFNAKPISQKLKKWPWLKIIIEKWERVTNSSKNHFYHSRLNSWATSKKPWAIVCIIGLSFLPYTYFIFGLGTAVIAAAKLLNVKYMILILLLGNAVRWTVIVFQIYQLFNTS